MDEHGNGEFAVGEHRDNMRQVGLDGPHILGVLGVIDSNFDSSAI